MSTITALSNRMDSSSKKWIIPQHRNSQGLSKTNRNNINDEQSYSSSFMDDYAKKYTSLEPTSGEESEPKRFFNNRAPAPKKEKVSLPKKHFTPLDEEKHLYFHSIPQRLLIKCDRGHLVPSKQKRTAVTDCGACKTIDDAASQGHKIMLMPDSVQLGMFNPLRWKCLHCFQTFYASTCAINENINTLRKKELKPFEKKSDEPTTKPATVELKYHTCIECTSDPCHYKPLSSAIIKQVFEMLTGYIPTHSIDFDNTPTAYHPLCPLVLLNDKDFKSNKVNVGKQIEHTCDILRKQLVRMNFDSIDRLGVCKYLLEEIPTWAEYCEVPAEVVTHVTAYVDNLYQIEDARLKRTQELHAANHLKQWQMNHGSKMN
jgi:hypothetical protein